MDRGIVYPGALTMDTDVLSVNKNAMKAVGALAELIFGQTQVCGGFTCSALSNTAVSGSAFAVQVSRGFVTGYQETDPNAYGSLGADATTNIVKCGINLNPTNIGLTNSAPVTAGYSTNYLISGAFSEADGTATVLPYYNASNPSSPYNGPGGVGTAQNTVRSQTVVFQVTAGTAAPTGTQTTPATPGGYVPLFIVTVTNGQTAVAGGNISVSPIAPFYNPYGAYVRYGGAQGNIVYGTTNSCSYTFTPPKNCVIQLSANANNAGGQISSFVLSGSGFTQVYRSTAGDIGFVGPWSDLAILTANAGVPVTITYTCTVPSIDGGVAFGFTFTALPTV